MTEREWKLGSDLSVHDNILDGISFYELIVTVHCNCHDINRETVMEELKNLVNMRLDDACDLLKNNIDEIIKRAKEW